MEPPLGGLQDVKLKQLKKELSLKRKKVNKKKTYDIDKPVGKSKYAKKGTERRNKKFITIKSTGKTNYRIHKNADTKNLEHGGEY